MIYILSLTFLVGMIIAVHSTIPTSTLQSDQILLFLGGMNIVTGGAMPYGFVNLFRQEVQALFTNVTVLSCGFPDHDGPGLLTNLDTFLTGTAKPDKVILSVGLEIFMGHSDITSQRRLKFELESLVARLKQDGIEVILCPVAFQGERVDIESNLSELLETYTAINKEVAKEYEVMHINMASRVDAFLEIYNVDSMEHSFLTLDGSILNERGHLFVALSLLREFGITKHSLSEENEILQEMLRVLALRQELDRVRIVVGDIGGTNGDGYISLL